MKMCDCNQGRLPCNCTCNCTCKTQTADQPHAEPVALPARKQWGGLLPTAENLRTEGWNACLDEIAKLGPLYRRPVQGEPVAWMYKRKGAEKELGQLVTMESEDIKDIRLGKCYENGTRYLWPREDYIDWQPLYTHADTGEVERLREQAQTNVRWQALANEQMGIIDTLRAKLAERDALLRTARKPLELRAEYDPTYPGNSMPRNYCAEALTAIDAALSASPEPRGALQFPGCAYADFNTAGYMPAGQAEKFSKSLLTHLGTNEERGPLSAEELDQARKRIEDAMRPLNADAPVERDERAEFEAWFKDHSKDWPFPCESIKCIARDNDWLVWQARAALERKP